MTFQEKLIILRKSKGLTQDEFASAVGVSRQAVYKWESGQSYPEVPKLLEMKLLFSISIDELLDDNYDIPLPEKKKRKRAPKTDAPVAKEAKPATKPATKPAAKPAPAVKPAPVAPKAEPVAPAVKPAPVAPKAEPVAPAVKPAPVAPKAEPVAPAVKPAPVAPKAEPVAPAVKPAPVAPKAEPVAPVAKEEPVAPKAEPVVDTVPSPILLEDIVAEEERKPEPEKKGFFGRIFGRK